MTFDGQSFVYAPADSVSLSQRVSALVADPHTMATTGLSGTTYATRSSTVAARTDPQVLNADRAVLIDMGGQSDLLASMTAATLLSTVEANAIARKAAGFDRVIATTIPSMTAAWGWTAPMEAQRVAYNDLLRASTVLDAVADVAAIPALADPSNTTYFSDGLHLTPVGADLAAPVIAATIT